MPLKFKFKVNVIDILTFQEQTEKSRIIYST